MKILQLTTYPTVNPLHGGQIRCFHIAENLRREGHEVHSIAIYIPGHYKDIGNEDIAIDTASSLWTSDPPELSDFFTGVYASSDVHTQVTLRNKILGFKPNVIIIEQPWLFNAARVAASGTAKLIYSSQNIESRLKEKVLATCGYANTALNSQITDVEKDAVIFSDLVIACTQLDADYYREVRGGENGGVILAGNGVEPFTCDDQQVSNWKSYFGRPYPVFVGSAHPPNASGFWDMNYPGLTYLKPHEQVVIIGGVCNLITVSDGIKNYSSVNLSRLHLVGMRAKVELQAMVRASHVVLLPITVGEGSNLKTAEALESGRKIIGTSKAFRGFESALKLPNVTIADTATDFRRAVRTTLDAPRYEGGTPLEVRSQFYWDSTLRLIPSAVSNIFASS